MNWKFTKSFMPNISLYWLPANHFHFRLLVGTLNLINLQGAAGFNVLLKGTSEMDPLTAAQIKPVTFLLWVLSTRKATLTAGKKPLLFQRHEVVVQQWCVCNTLGMWACCTFKACSSSGDTRSPIKFLTSTNIFKWFPGKNIKCLHPLNS